ncbi:hypothetical protein WME94_45285 [Sorangium sp. So ce429]
MIVDPAEEIVLVMTPNISADGLVTEEALLQAGAEAALGQDGRSAQTAGSSSSAPSSPPSYNASSITGAIASSGSQRSAPL